MSDIKIKSVYKELTYYITTEDGLQFRRSASGDCELFSLDGGHWLPIEDEINTEELEQAYQSFMQEYEEW